MPDTIEETNRLRVSLGMKPLPSGNTPPSEGSSSESDDDPASTLERRQAQGESNWRQLQDEAEAKQQRKARADAVRKARDAAQKFNKLDGKGLGEISDEEGKSDARTWLLQQKKRRKRIEQERAKAEKMERELAERERVEYTEKDLTGLNVSHAMEEFEGAGEQILTLKDATIDENEDEGDELENAELKAKQTLEERLDLKKRKPTYDPTEDMMGEKTSILSHYDEKQRKTFRLDGQLAESERAAMKAKVGQKMQSISLDLPNTISSDYAVEKAPTKIKAKKRKAQPRQRQEEIVEAEPVVPTRDSYVDDDDLQASLARQRAMVLKKRRKTRPEDLAQQVREIKEEEVFDGGMVIDETSEFVASLERPIEETKKEVESPDPAPVVPIKEEEMPDVMPEAETNITGLEEDAKLNGMGATLSMLSQRGLIAPRSEEDIVGLHRERQRFLYEKQKRETEIEQRARQQRERDRTSGRLAHMSAREREEYARNENKQRDQYESRVMTDVFNREYKPDVQLKYMDNFGRNLNPKEAFKFLSHQFHGKGSGKQKTEKHLKKVEEQRVAESKSLLDATQDRGMNNAQGATAKKTRQAGVRMG